MKLYLTPGACSLADHIALREADLDFEAVRVDLRAKKTEVGDDFNRVNPKGYVPALVLDDGALLTENAAILSWIAERAPHLKPRDTMARTRLIEMLAYISAEVHKPFGRLMFAKNDEDKAEAKAQITSRLTFLAERLKSDYLLGVEFSAADAYFYVMLRWAKRYNVELPAPLEAYCERIEARPSVKAALEEEGLAKAA